MISKRELKRRVKNRFLKLYGSGQAPSYKTVKKEHPVLFEEIMKHWNGYRAFCRSLKIEPPTPTKQQEAFIAYSSRAAKRYYSNGEWSRFEREIKPILDRICGEIGLTYKHNHPYPSMNKGYFYKFDFYFFKHKKPIRKRLECDGVFHSIGSTKERDKEIDAYLKERGIDTLRISFKETQDPELSLRIRKWLTLKSDSTRNE